VIRPGLQLVVNMRSYRVSGASQLAECLTLLDAITDTCDHRFGLKVRQHAELTVAVINHDVVARIAPVWILRREIPWIALVGIGLVRSI
jgi:hypothetical protein